jgi:hypothetical protein
MGNFPTNVLVDQWHSLIGVRMRRRYNFSSCCMLHIVINIWLFLHTHQYIYVVAENEFVFYAWKQCQQNKQNK